VGAASYVERRVPFGLATHACCVWRQVAGPEGHAQQVLPDGCADVVWIEGVGLELAGPATEHVVVRIPPGATVLGVRFGPGAAGPALGLAASELRDQTVGLDALWGPAAVDLQERLATAAAADRPALLADAVAARLREARPPDVLVAGAAELLARGMTVAAASREVALGARHLRRRFHEAVGYGPKTLQRVLRLRRFLALAEAAPVPDLARAAVEAGYADQSHLTRECGELAGLPPAALLAARETVSAARV
jgi:methylphosphotriester-DNA--protein-cysteine methyltransferase